MKFYIEDKYINEGLVTVREHPNEPYLIYNYTPLCAFSKAWDEVTLQCRGLIVHKDTRDVIARPFPKFFNYEEHIANGGQIPNEQPRVYDKRDGSLGILYFGVNGHMYIATRGSFVSDQALWACEWLNKHGADLSFDPSVTYLFEIVYPANRIVVDYKGYQGLDLLAAIHTETGKELPFHPIKTPFGTPVMELPWTGFESLKAQNDKNKEGFVLHFPNANLRLKIKFEDYVRLHKIMTALSEIGIWEMLRDGKTLPEIIADIPDEMNEWLEGVVNRLQSAFDEIEMQGQEVTRLAKKYNTRKEQAEVIMQAKNPSVAFAMLDNKDYKKIIWKMVRPHGSTTFRRDIDA